MADGSGSPIAELLIVFALVFAAQVVSALADLIGALFVLSPPISEAPWTLATSVYAHESIQRLVSNAIALVLFGWPVARATTRVRFHLFFLLSGVLAGVSQILLSDAAGVLGASGAVFALLGYLLASNRLSSGVASIVRLPAWVSLVVFVVVAAGLTIATAEPGVALVAHFTGLLFGLIAGRLRVLRPGRTTSASPA